MVVTSMLDVFIRGQEDGAPGGKTRAAELVEELYRLAKYGETGSIRLAALKEIFDRVDGKAVERKEIKSMTIDGVVYLPAADDSARIVFEEA